MKGNITAQKIKTMLKINKLGYYAVGNGLYLRISKERTGFWVVRYTIHKNRKETSIGQYPEMSLADANSETTLIKRNIKNNIDPLAEKKREQASAFNTVDDLAEDWLKDCERRLKHPNIPRRVYEKDLSPTIGALAIDQVTPMDIRTIFTKIANSGRPSVSNDSLMYLKQLFRHGLKLNLLIHNPAEPFTIADAGGVEKSRDRALSLEELKEVFSTFRENHNQFVRENYLAVALLLCLGVRKGELVGAKWSEFNFDKSLWSLPKERSKSGVAIDIPLSTEVITWLQELKIRAFNSEFVFPNRRASKRANHISPDTLNAAIQKLFREEKMTVEHFTVHDLRRTCRSLLAELGTPGHVAERCLNHKLKGVEGIYDRYDYMAERREALQTLSLKAAALICI